MDEAHLAPDPNNLMMSCLQKWCALGGKGMWKYLTAGKDMMSFAYDVLEDGTTFTTEVPNVVWALPKMTTGSRAPS